MSTLDWITASIATYGYVALFLACVVEGPIATVIGAFLASQGILDIWLVLGVSVIGDLVGDLLYYAVGRSGRFAAVLWWRKPSPRQQWRIRGLKRRFRSHLGKTLLFGKLTHAAGFLVLLAAGAARVPLLPFLWYNLLGTLVKSAVFLLVGGFAGAAYARINAYLGLGSLVVFILICVAAGIYLGRRLSAAKIGRCRLARRAVQR